MQETDFVIEEENLDNIPDFDALSELSEFKKAAVSYISGYAGMNNAGTNNAKYAVHSYKRKINYFVCVLVLEYVLGVWKNIQP